jgi:hypothetical protein
MRTPKLAVTIVLAAATLAASAQPRNESVGPFTYEAVGATPSLAIGRKAATKTEAPKAGRCRQDRRGAGRGRSRSRRVHLRRARRHARGRGEEAGRLRDDDAPADALTCRKPAARGAVAAGLPC